MTSKPTRSKAFGYSNASALFLGDVGRGPQASSPNRNADSGPCYAVDLSATGRVGNAPRAPNPNRWRTFDVSVSNLLSCHCVDRRDSRLRRTSRVLRVGGQSGLRRRPHSRGAIVPCKRVPKGALLGLTRRTLLSTSLRDVRRNPRRRSARRAGPPRQRLRRL